MTNISRVGFDLLGFSDLYTRYLNGDPDVRARFPGDPFDLGSTLAAADALADRDYPRVELMKRLADYNQELGAGEATLGNIDALKKPNTFVVCTGQQPTILTGPLFTIYKTVSCLILARRLNAASDGRRFVPVFWCASEDHDLEEMNHIHLPGPDGEVRRLRSDLVNDGRPAEAVVVGKNLRRIIREANKVLPDSEFKSQVLALFEPEDGDTLGTWFNRVLISLFSDDGLVVLEPRLIRDLGAHVIRRELDLYEETSRRLREAGKKIIALGAKPAFEGKCRVHAFHLGEQRRNRIRFYADFCILGDDRIDRRELDYHLEEEADRFSPDAVLRPIVQGAVLPVVAYVAGPGEIAYHAQLREIHELFDVPMPVIHPRASVTLLEGAVVRAMDKYGLEPRQLFVAPEERESIVVGSARGRELAESLDGHIAETSRHLDALEQEVASFEPGVSRVVRKIHTRINRDLTSLKRRVIDAIDEAAGVSRRQINRIFANTMPRDLPQERVYNILHYLVKYGPDLPRGLLHDLDQEPREHFVYTLGAFETLATRVPAEEEAPGEEEASAEEKMSAADPDGTGDNGEAADGKVGDDELDGDGPDANEDVLRN